MADFIDNIKTGFAEFQDTFGSAGIGNGASLVRAAALGKPIQGSYQIGFTSAGNQASINNRVYLKIPEYYTPNGSMTYTLSGEKNLGWQGIYFPVTPSIKQDYKANWTASSPQQSNYAIHSFNNSDVGSITVSGQFPVQSAEEGYYYTATINALRSLIKMRTGKDQVPGAPPPVCRFYAYGADIYENVPVVIGDFSIDLPADVDYITSYNFNDQPNKVPALSTITLTLIPVYSRREMAAFSVDSFVKGGLSGKGYV